MVSFARALVARKVSVGKLPFVIAAAALVTIALGATHRHWLPWIKEQLRATARAIGGCEELLEGCGHPEIVLQQIEVRGFAARSALRPNRWVPRRHRADREGS
jgi:hypothetical protein